jgi:hypothetical protein
MTFTIDTVFVWVTDHDRSGLPDSSPIAIEPATRCNCWSDAGDAIHKCSVKLNTFGSTDPRDLLDSVSGGAERPTVDRKSRCIPASWGFSFGSRDVWSQSR